ncbi:hypothetical protein COV20_01820 [Candidatus Woesearchaeota archaeon CG10_big_fil_rev_8_21_14_0_10_45_16]|nr:MAG: hypothetical protein COV20_01820 [Candidatus Woesearchaeota archaeon CG10_big_fil_rev_8_21_14_0_10_45_16]
MLNKNHPEALILQDFKEELYHGKKLRGLSTTTDSLNIPEIINYLSIEVKDTQKLLSRLDDLKRNRFIELLLPLKLYTPELLPKLAGVRRIIITASKPIDNVEKIFAELITNRFYPLVKGAPLCSLPLENTYEFFQKAKPTEKAAACDGCLLKGRCPSDGSFNPRPITILDKEALSFIEKHENTDSRF